MKKTFEDRLLDELKQEVALNGAEKREPVRRRITPRRVALGLAACTAAALAAVALPGSPAESKAYAIEKNSDGTITVSGEEFDDPMQLEKDLRAAGLDATVDRIVDRKPCHRQAGLPGTPEADENADLMKRVHKDTEKVVSRHAEPYRVVIDPSKLKPGRHIQVDINSFVSTMTTAVSPGEKQAKPERVARTTLEFYVAAEELPTPKRFKADTSLVDCAVE